MTRLLAVLAVLVAAGGCAVGGVTSDPVQTVPTIAPPATLPTMTALARTRDSGYDGAGVLYAICENGHRVYVFDGAKRSGVAAVPDPTCPGATP